MEDGHKSTHENQGHYSAPRNLNWKNSQTWFHPLGLEKLELNCQEQELVSNIVKIKEKLQDILL